MNISQNVDKTQKKKTYTIDEIAQQLDICKKTAYRLVRKKKFHSVKIGNAIRVSKKSFDEWLHNSY